MTDPDFERRQRRIDAALGEALRALGHAAIGTPGSPQKAARRALARYLARAKPRGGKQ